MQRDEIYDVIIIGGGPGGLSAAVYSMRAGLRTALIEKHVAGGQVAMTDSVENYPGFENISGFELSQRFLKHAQSYDLEMLQGEVVIVEPGPEFHSVVLASGDLMKTHAVILATGGSPRKLNVPGENAYYGRGVSYCGVCDGFLYKDRTVAVVGGGNTAVEEALYLSKLASQVYIVHRRDALRASKIAQQRVMEEDNIEVLWNTVVKEIRANELGVSGVILQDARNGEERELLTDGVFIFIGFVPNNHLVPGTIVMNEEGFVLANERCETNVPGIYVVGDLREKFAKQIVVAAADGCTSALAAAHYIEMVKSGEHPAEWVEFWGETY